MSPKLTPAQAEIASQIQSIRVAPGIPTVWLPVSFVMAHVRIESGFNPTIEARDFATTGSVGLMQVAAPTVGDMVSKWAKTVKAKSLPIVYGADGGWDQTDAYTSLCTGMLYLAACRDYLALRVRDLDYSQICVAYNEGPGNAARGRPDPTYYYKWLSAQQAYAYLDKHPAPVF